MKKITVKLTDNEKKKIQFVISCHLSGTPSLKDIQAMDTTRGYFPDTDRMKLKRFDTARKGWSNGYFYISILGKMNVVFLFFGDSEEPGSEKSFYFPKEGASPSYEWDFLNNQLDEAKNGVRFLNRFSECLTSCGVECYLCATECNHLYEKLGHCVYQETKGNLPDEETEEEGEGGEPC